MSLQQKENFFIMCILNIITEYSLKFFSQNKHPNCVRIRLVISLSEREDYVPFNAKKNYLLNSMDFWFRNLKVTYSNFPNSQYYLAVITGFCLWYWQRRINSE